MRLPVVRVVAALLLEVLLCAASGADEPKADAPKEETPSLRVPSDEEAAKLIEEVKTATKKKKAAEVLPTLAKLEGLAHPDFLKPLMKVLSHEDSEVALLAADLLDVQPPDVDPKVQSKNAKELWKAGWDHPANKGRPVVRGATVRVIGAWGVLLDDAQMGDVLSSWRAQVSNPLPEKADGLVGIAVYARKTKDKRLCRVFAEELDQPVATDVNSGTNPPAAWWEARWKVWDKIHSPVHDALTAITGQDFKSTDEAKAWFKENEKTFGFKW